MTALLSVCLCSCGGGGNSLDALAGIYAEIANNNQSLAEAFQKVYAADRDEQPALMENARKTADEVKEKNEALELKASELGAGMLDTEVDCKASAGTGITVSKAVITDISANGNFANIVITVDYSGELEGKPYFLVTDGSKTLYKSLASSGNGKLIVNFRLNAGNASAFVGAKEIVIVTEAEYRGDTASSDTAAAEPAEPEPAFEGNESAPAVSAEGIKVGDNLIQVLGSAPNVTYDYNADSGIWATIGNIAIVIDEDQLNAQGIEFINSILSDIAPGIDFKPEYLKSDARVKQIEVQ